VFTDGDIPSRLTRFFEAGNWFDPARGQVPMNWGIDPALAQEFPALFEYFYTNATSNDYFVAGPSSAGYTHPSVMPNLASYGAFVSACDAVVGVDAAVIWDYDLSPSIYDGFLRDSGLEVIVHSAATDDLTFRGSHVPVFAQTFFWRWWDSQAPPEQIASDVAAELSQGFPPAFATFYDGQMQRPGIAKQVMDILAPQGYQFLRLDEMNALARQIDHFYDVGIKYWAHDQVEACFNAGIVQGFTATHYRPTLPVTRDQMAVYISRALAGGDDQVPTGPATAAFPDVPTDYWAFKYVEYAVSKSVVKGYSDGTYKPTDQVDRGQMSVFIARAIATPSDGADLVNYTPPTTATFPDVPTSFWAYKYVEYIAQPSIAVTNGYPDGDYHPEYVCTRDQMVVYVARAFNLPV
jgi:hypothetical protein